MRDRDATLCERACRVRCEGLVHATLAGVAALRALAEARTFGARCTRAIALVWTCSTRPLAARSHGGAASCEISSFRYVGHPVAQSGLSRAGWPSTLPTARSARLVRGGTPPSRTSVRSLRVASDRWRSYSGFSSRNPSGGTVSVSDCAKPCDGHRRTSTRPAVADVAAAVDLGVAVEHFAIRAARAARRCDSRAAGSA